MMKPCLVFLALQLAAAANLRSSNGNRQIQETPTLVCRDVTIDFESNLDTGNAFQAGDIITDLGSGVNVYAQKINLVSDRLVGRNRAMIYNTNYVTGGDNDLNVNLGNALIITENFDRSDPNDRDKGGLITFSFGSESIPNKVKLLEIVDIDYVDATGTGRGHSYINGTRSDGSMIPPTVIVPGRDGNVQTVTPMDATDVTQLRVRFASTGAITRMVLEYCEESSGTSGPVTPAPTPMPTPNPTSAPTMENPLEYCEQMPEGFRYHIVNSRSGKALNIQHVSTEDGGNVHQWTIHTHNEPGYENDNWRFHSTNEESGYYHLIVEHSGKALDVEGASMEEGANIVQNVEKPGMQTSDDWCFVKAGQEGYFWIININSGLVLDVAEGSLSNGGNVIQNMLDPLSPLQVWKVEPALPIPGDRCTILPENEYFEIINVNSNKAVNVQSVSGASGANVFQLDSESYFENDNWRFETTGKAGFYHVIVQHSEKSLHIENPAQLEGASIVQSDISGETSGTDDWCFIPTGIANTYWVISHYSQMLLDVASQSLSNQGNIIQHVYDQDSSSQMWRITPVSPIQKGWVGPFDTSDVVGTGAANLPDGRVLLFSSKEKDHYAGSVNGRTFTTIFDPLSQTSTGRLVENTRHDMFCSGTAVLPNGDVLITGGSNARRATLYSPSTDTWSSEARMVVRRGYHSMTMLPDGNVFTLGGSWSGGIGGKYGEIWNMTSSSWTAKRGIPANGTFLTDDPEGVYRSDNHMWLFTAPNGLVFHAGPSRRMHWIDTAGEGSYAESELRGDDDDAMTGVAVMFDIGKILTAGGSTSYSSNTAASRKSYVIDVNDDTAVKVTRTSNMLYPRTLHNCVVLASGEVIVVGGISTAKLFSDDGAIMPTEIWNPQTGKYSLLPSLQEPRTYHSTAILLADGRVLAAGGGLCGNCAVNHPNVEILTPPYLLDANDEPVQSRPIIRQAPTDVDIGASFVVAMDTSEQHTFAFVRLSAVTHSVNNDQRRIPLTATNIDGGVKFELDVPSNRAVALPGTYFLFAMNSDGVPSVAATVTVNA